MTVWEFRVPDSIGDAGRRGYCDIAAARLLLNRTAAGARPQIVVPKGAWQAARPLGAWTLVGCTVSPAFSFDGFELAPEGWSPEIALQAK